MAIFPITVEYAAAAKDFREATYFVLTKRYNVFLRASIITLILTGVYFTFSLLGFSFAVAIQPMLIFVLFSIVFIYALFLVQTEHGIRKYLRSKNNLIGCDCTISFEEKAVKVIIPKQSFNKSYPIERFSCVLESRNLLLLYVSEEDLHIVGTRHIASEDLSAIRSHLRNALGNNYISRKS